MQFASLHCKETKATSARNRRASITLLQLYNRSQLASFDQQIDWTLKREDSVVRDRSYLLFGSFLYTFSLMTDILRSRWQVSGKNTNLRYRDTPPLPRLIYMSFWWLLEASPGAFFGDQVTTVVRKSTVAQTGHDRSNGNPETFLWCLGNHWLSD